MTTSSPSVRRATYASVMLSTPPETATAAGAQSRNTAVSRARLAVNISPFICVSRQHLGLCGVAARRPAAVTVAVGDVRDFGLGPWFPSAVRRP